MDYRENPESARKKTGTVKRKTRNNSTPPTHKGVFESASYLPERKVEQLLSDIVTRLERIEEKIDENVYPPESAIKPELIRQLKKAQADIRKGKGKTYESMDAFIEAISE